MPASIFLLMAALSGLIAVALGAFGTHGLKGYLAPYLMDVYQTGVQYQFYHTLALLVVAVLGLREPVRALNVAGWCFALGIVLFSGSLYLLALSGTHWLGAVTPIGGLAFLVGWAALAYSAIQLSGKLNDAD
ncbi:DUF423 domain-containing protein [Pontibacterium granulatum]|uniref:DUF423 domain-containing protein n=1 Tax=Pontibacterium granulatum TaxID=2036029 RepID=UPI00249C7920|nr:DUF423 domain-containing protein [Pontibacterium granulatum]MDI3324340.1 DUF423 domain-containing protein [Pontibacterium granulatum]